MSDLERAIENIVEKRVACAIGKHEKHTHRYIAELGDIVHALTKRIEVLEGKREPAASEQEIAAHDILVHFKNYGPTVYADSREGESVWRCSMCHFLYRESGMWLNPRRHYQYCTWRRVHEAVEELARIGRLLS